MKSPLITITSLLLAAESVGVGTGQASWKEVYRDDDVRIEMNLKSVTRVREHFGSLTFRWTWTKPRSLKQTPGMMYRSRIEATEFDCKSRLIHSASVRMFDSAGKEIKFDRQVPSTKWDPIPTGSIASIVADAACPLLR
jgi:hypothetical protein